MVKINRRNFTAICGATISAIFLGKAPVYRAKFSINLDNFSGPSEFYKIQGNHEKTESIKRLNNQYQVSGKLLYFDHYQIDNNLIWEYAFDSKDSFDQWESDLYENQYVDNVGRKELPTRQFSYSFFPNINLFS